ncbi:type II toxin-antitoxin system RelE/ParE family toxin [Azospirillum sp. ST 5-10]|uniref:type II toxin-antitoxin system RelE/ParE family toxin n=1 Tax=unclassified Azospirillum TaxID=2630922 RepID=UPI003F4A458B
MSHKVQFSPEAQNDLLEIYDCIAGKAGAARALGYVERIEQYCLRLANFPERGTARDDIRQGLRVIGFEGRATVAFHVDAGHVTILRILYAGRDLTGV